jgi:hypothetical protein
VITAESATPDAAYFEEVDDEGHLRYAVVTEESRRAEIDAVMARLSFSICGFNAPVTR